MKERVLELLRSSARPMTVEEVADALRTSIRSARRALVELKREGLVELEGVKPTSRCWARPPDAPASPGLREGV